MMILSNDCYLRNSCWKYLNTDAECKDSTIYCPKLFRIDYLYNEALLSQKQRLHKALRFDADGTDRTAFVKLKEIEQNIEQFVNDGQNLTHI